MKYEFHVGDYVEMANGLVGWVCQVKDDDCICVADKYVTGYYRIPEELRYFNRIGQYDFTKKGEGEIEPIFDDPADWEDSVVLDKINELVEAVNSIKKEINNG